MTVSGTPWLMPLGSASTGVPLLSMASLAGDSAGTEAETDAGDVLGVTQSGSESDVADGAASPGSLVSGDEAERRPKRVAASTGDGADLLLPMLLTLALLALLALFVVVRNRRPSTAGDAPAAAGRDADGRCPAGGSRWGGRYTPAAHGVRDRIDARASARGRDCGRARRRASTAGRT